MTTTHIVNYLDLKTNTIIFSGKTKTRELAHSIAKTLHNYGRSKKLYVRKNTEPNDYDEPRDGSWVHVDQSANDQPKFLVEIVISKEIQ